MRFVLLVFIIASSCSTTRQSELVVQRFPCYGKCKHYSIKISPDKSFDFVNLTNNDTIQGYLNYKQSAQLKELLNQIEFKDSIQYFGRNIRDLQQSKIQFGNHSILIYGNRFASKEHLDLFAWIERLIKERPK